MPLCNFLSLCHDCRDFTQKLNCKSAMSFPGSTYVLYRHDLVIPFFSFLSFHAYVARLITILQRQNAISEYVTSNTFQPQYTIKSLWGNTFIKPFSYPCIIQAVPQHIFL